MSDDTAVSCKAKAVQLEDSQRLLLLWLLFCSVGWWASRGQTCMQNTKGSRTDKEIRECVCPNQRETQLSIGASLGQAKGTLPWKKLLQNHHWRIFLTWNKGSQHSFSGKRTVLTREAQCAKEENSPLTHPQPPPKTRKLHNWPFCLLLVSLSLYLSLPACFPPSLCFCVSFWIYLLYCFQFSFFFFLSLSLSLSLALSAPSLASFAVLI